MFKKIICIILQCILPTIIISIIFFVLCMFLSIQGWFIKLGFVVIILTGIVSIISLLNRMYVSSAFINFSTLIGLSLSANDIWETTITKKPNMGFIEALILIPLLGLIAGLFLEVLYQLNKNNNRGIPRD
ncbi:MAG TPA: hypothetical protein VIK72_11145 [Clostridiaceae bacterium]